MRALWVTVATGILCAFGTTAWSAQFAANYEYSGGTPPAGNAPWVTAIFAQGDRLNPLTLTLSAHSLTGGEYIDDWMFNVNPSIDPALLNFTISRTTGNFTNPLVRKQADGYSAPGNTNFDIFIDFMEFQETPGIGRFDAGDSITFQITSSQPVSASSFEFRSTAGAMGSFYTAAHVEGIANGGGSGWVTVPEPASLSLLALGAIMLRRRSSHK